MKNSNLWIAGAVAAMFAASCHGAIAQDNSAAGTDSSTTTSSTTTTAAPDASATTTTSTTTTTSSTPMNEPDPSVIPTIPPYANAGIDYSVLNNKYYDEVDLRQAHEAGYSDNAIATIAKISEQTGTPFREVEAWVNHGQTFPMIAMENNLRLSDVLDVSDEKTKIANYEQAYDTTGYGAMKNSGGMMPHMDMSNTTTYSTTATSSKDVVDTLASSRRFSTLVKELQIAGLTDTLHGAGPFTIFAPTNRAFSNLPSGTLDQLNSDPNRLRAVLTYHVIPARITAATAMSMTSPTSPATVEGDTLQVTTNNGNVMINNAKVTQADILASNGVIHGIDQVLMPPSSSTTTTSVTTTTTTAPATTDNSNSNLSNGNTNNNTNGAAGTNTTTPAPANQ